MQMQVSSLLRNPVAEGVLPVSTHQRQVQDIDGPVGVHIRVPSGTGTAGAAEIGADASGVKHVDEVVVGGISTEE